MKAITLWQPWASLMAFEEKLIETRSWGTDYRGPLAIHAAVNYPKEGRKFAEELFVAKAMHGKTPVDKNHPLLDPNFITILTAHHIASNLPRGVILAVVNLYNVVPVDEPHLRICDKERAFGNYAPGRFAWLTKFVKRFDPPIAVKGQRGLWNWEVSGESEDPEMIQLVGKDFQPTLRVPIIKKVDLFGVPGFAVHAAIYRDGSGECKTLEHTFSVSLISCGSLAGVGESVKGAIDDARANAREAARIAGVTVEETLRSSIAKVEAQVLLRERAS